MNQSVFLAFDLGGTKLEAAVVDDQASVLNAHRVKAQFWQGKDAVLLQIVELGDLLLKKYPNVQAVGFASAGPLDSQKGVLLSPTHFVDRKGIRWGEVPIVDFLKKRWGLPTFLINDAAAATLGEVWKGEHAVTNFMVLTLGTGLGTGFWRDGELFKVFGESPEAGHFVFNLEDKAIRCPCGIFGCAETYVAPSFFLKRLREVGYTFLEGFNAKDWAEAAFYGQAEALKAFDAYAEVFAKLLLTYTRLYGPKKFVISGSFAKAHSFFLKKSRENFEKVSNRPVWVEVSPLQNKMGELQAGLLGAAFWAKTAPSLLSSFKNREQPFSSN